ncbi:MAG: hypothetical protein ACOCYB_11480 [Alkalispirochaeta sp.]
MEWFCAIGGIATTEALESAYGTIRELLIDRPEPIQHVSMKRLTISYAPDKGTRSICIHSLAVPPDIDQLGQLLSMLVSDYPVHVWGMGPELTTITLSRFRGGVPIGSRHLRVDSVDPDRLFGNEVIRLSAMEAVHLPPARFVERVRTTFDSPNDPVTR